MKELLKKLNMENEIIMQSDFSAFALDNEGLRYVLAKTKGAPVELYERFAVTSWEKSSDVVKLIIGRIKQMKAFSTVSILEFKESYQALEKMCQVRYSVQFKVFVVW